MSLMAFVGGAARAASEGLDRRAELLREEELLDRKEAREDLLFEREIEARKEAAETLAIAEKDRADLRAKTSRYVADKGAEATLGAARIKSLADRAKNFIDIGPGLGKIRRKSTAAEQFKEELNWFQNLSPERFRELMSDADTADALTKAALRLYSNGTSEYLKKSVNTDGITLFTPRPLEALPSLANKPALVQYFRDLYEGKSDAKISIKPTVQERERPKDASNLDPFLKIATGLINKRHFGSKSRTSTQSKIDFAVKKLGPEIDNPVFTKGVASSFAGILLNGDIEYLSEAQKQKVAQYLFNPKNGFVDENTGALNSNWTKFASIFSSQKEQNTDPRDITQRASPKTIAMLAKVSEPIKTMVIKEKTEAQRKASVARDILRDVNVLEDSIRTLGSGSTLTASITAGLDGVSELTGQLGDLLKRGLGFFEGNGMFNVKNARATGTTQNGEKVFMIGNRRFTESAIRSLEKANNTFQLSLNISDKEKQAAARVEFLDTILMYRLAALVQGEGGRAISDNDVKLFRRTVGKATTSISGREVRFKFMRKLSRDALSRHQIYKLLRPEANSGIINTVRKSLSLIDDVNLDNYLDIYNKNVPPTNNVTLKEEDQANKTFSPEKNPRDALTYVLANPSMIRPGLTNVSRKARMKLIENFETLRQGQPYNIIFKSGSDLDQAKKTNDFFAINATPLLRVSAVYEQEKAKGFEGRYNRPNTTENLRERISEEIRKQYRSVFDASRKNLYAFGLDTDAPMQIPLYMKVDLDGKPSYTFNRFAEGVILPDTTNNKTSNAGLVDTTIKAAEAAANKVFGK
tara:strand:- start:4499 stop:6928 length:2430 start_codon:yes stop_codon:yes gene_type:complete